MNKKNFLSNLSRRAFLQAGGVALALPWMEALAVENEKDMVKPATRFLSVYHPDGVGMPLKEDPAWKDWSWFPHAGKTENDFKLTKILDVLEPLRNDITIYSGLSHPAGRKVHGHINADAYLTGANISGDGLYKNSISVDQLFATEVGRHTRLASLVLSTNGGVGSPRNTQTPSFNVHGRPIPAMNDPKQIFDMLFVTSGKDSRDILARSKSALDILVESTRSLNEKLSKHDRQTLDQYLTAIRETEVKLTKAERWIDTPMPTVDTSGLKLAVSVKESSRDFIQTIYQLIYLAFLSDSTRVATFMWGRENTGGIHDQVANACGFPNAHALTHDVKKPNGWQNLGVYNRFQAEEFGRFLQKLKDTPEPKGNGTMLDNTLAMHGSASSSFHYSRNYPIITAGGKGLGFKNGRYLKFGSGNEDNQKGAGSDSDKTWEQERDYEEEPLARLYTSIINKLGIRTDEFAGCKGSLKRV